MAVRLRSLYYSDANVPYGIEIHDKELTTDLNYDFDMPIAGGPVLSYDNDEINIFNPIVTTSCSFTMWLDNAFHEAFFTLLSTSPEGRFFVRLYYMDGNTEVTLHVGNVIHDLVSVSESDSPTLTVNSSDPLMELETEDYAPLSGGVSGIIDNSRERYIDILIEHILDRCKCLTYFYPDDNYPLLEILNEYYPSSDSDGDDMLSRTLIKNYFRKEEEGKSDQRESCTYVLAEILRSLGSRIYFDKGRYLIEQIGAKVNEVVTTSIYTRDRSLLGTSLLTSNDLTWTREMATPTAPRKSLIPPARYVELTQSAGYQSNQLFSEEMGVDEPFAQKVVTEVYDSDQGLKIYLSLKMRAWIDKEDSQGNLIDYQYFTGDVEPWARYSYMKVTLLVRVGDRVLSGYGKLNYLYQGTDRNLVIEDAEWSSVLTDRLIVYIPIYHRFANFNKNSDSYIQNVSIITPEVDDVGDVMFGHSSTVETSPLYQETSSDYTDYQTLYYPSKATNLTLVGDVDDLEDESGSVLIRLPNDEDNTIVINTEYEMGSFPDTSSQYRVYVLSDTYVDGTNIFESEDWVHPDIGLLPYQQLALYDILGMNRVARQRLEIGLYLADIPISMRTRLVYRGKVYIPFYIKVLSVEDTVTGLWIEVGKELISPPIPEEEFPDVGLPGISGIGVINGLQGGGGSTTSNEVEYYKLIEDNSGEYVDISDYLGLPDPTKYTGQSIRKSWSVFLGGTKQRFKDVSRASLATGEYRINYAEKRLEWKRSVEGKIVEMYINGNYVLDTTSTT